MVSTLPVGLSSAAHCETPRGTQHRAIVLIRTLFISASYFPLSLLLLSLPALGLPLARPPYLQLSTKARGSISHSSLQYAPTRLRAWSVVGMSDAVSEGEPTTSPSPGTSCPARTIGSGERTVLVGEREKCQMFSITMLPSSTA